MQLRPRRSEAHALSKRILSAQALHRVRDTKGSAFDKRLFDHEMTRLAVATFEKATRFKGLA